MKKRSLTEDEKRLWGYVTRHDQLLPESRMTDGGRQVTKMTIPFRLPDLPSPSAFHHPPSDQPLAPGSYANIDRNTAERFRRGDYPIDATLDLHGMTREKAHRALCMFLKTHHDQGNRCLLVITGKGKTPSSAEAGSAGVLRETLPQWLGEPGLRGMVLAFDSAKPKHGGAGAFYILLRRRRNG